MDNKIDEKNGVRAAIQNCTASIESSIECTLKNTSIAASAIKQYIEAEKLQNAELAQKMNAYNAIFEKLATSAENVCKTADNLNKKLSASCIALSVIENQEEMLEDIKSSFAESFAAHSFETQKKLQRTSEKLISVAHQCDFFKSSPKPWTEMVRRYSTKIEMLFGKIEAEKKTYTEEQKQLRSIYFLIDCSGSMEGEKIKAVNTSLSQLLPDLLKLGITQTAVLAFATECFWMHNSKNTLKIPLFRWQGLEPSGMTSFGKAIFELYKALSQIPKGRSAPKIVVISDGEPSDDWETPFTLLSQPTTFRFVAHCLSHRMPPRLPL